MHRGNDMFTLQFFAGLAIGCGVFGILMIGFFFYAMHVFEKINNKYYSLYANRIEAAVVQLERKAAEK